MFQEFLIYYALGVATVMGALFGWGMNNRYRKWKRLKKQQANWPYDEEI
jgi:hypothetical protein